MKVADLKAASVVANRPWRPTFNIPQVMLASAAKPRRNVTPFQWIIRRQFLGFYYVQTRCTGRCRQPKLDDMVECQPTQATAQYDFIATNNYLIAVESAER